VESLFGVFSVENRADFVFGLGFRAWWRRSKEKTAFSSPNPSDTFYRSVSFPNALKYVLRQDPDVILVGEMRDLETVAAALTAAETGHLVLATLHTNDAVQTIDRVIDVFPDRQQQQVRVQLSLTLLSVISQRLLPKATGDGRVLAVEILRNTHSSANLIREGKTHQLYSIIETGTKDGMVTLDASLMKLYQRGLVTAEEAQRHMHNPQALIDFVLQEKPKQAPAAAAFK
jgi:twitching motility protein PilT